MTYSWAFMFDDMYRGNSKRAGGTEPGPEGLISFGMNPMGTGPNTGKMIAALSKLKWLVVAENVETETAQFWKAPKEYGGAEPSKIQTEVFLLPAALFAEKDGTLHELGALGAVEVEGPRSAGPSQAGPGDPGAPRARREGALRQGGRRVPRGDRRT